MRVSPEPLLRSSFEVRMVEEESAAFTGGTVPLSSLSPSFHVRLSSSWSTQQNTQQVSRQYNKSPRKYRTVHTIHMPNRECTPYPGTSYTVHNSKPYHLRRGGAATYTLACVQRYIEAHRPWAARFVAPPGRTHSTRDAQRALRISPCGPTTLATPAPPPAARPATCAACCRRGEPPRGAGPG